jgi:hypothetical protein
MEEGNCYLPPSNTSHELTRMEEGNCYLPPSNTSHEFSPSHL